MDSDFHVTTYPASPLSITTLWRHSLTSEQKKTHKPLQNVIETISRPPTDTQDIRDNHHSVVYWWVKFRRKQQCANLLSWQRSFLGPIIGRLLDTTSPAVLVKIQRLVNCLWKSHWVSSWRNCRTSNASSPPSNSHHYPFFSWSSSLWLPTSVHV